MDKLITMLLGKPITDEPIYQEYDYSLSDKSDKEIFLKEFKKFLGMYSELFYDLDRFVTNFNSNEISLGKNILQHLLNMYNYAKTNDLYREKTFLAEFLYTYYKGINTLTYKKNCIDFKNAREDFRKVIEEFKLQEEFFNDIVNELYTFYKQVVGDAIANDIYIDARLINRIFNNLESKEQRNDIIELFIINKKNLFNIIYFDMEKENHKEVYIEYMVNSFENYDSYQYQVKEMLYELEKDNVLTDETCKNIINQYIILINKLCNRLRSRDNCFIIELNGIDELKDELNYILKNVKSLSSIQKNKVKELRKRLLWLKRHIISDEGYVNGQMHELYHETKIEKSRMEKLKIAIANKPISIYANSKMNFSNIVEGALKFYSEHPLQRMAKNFYINSQKQVYSLGVDGRKKVGDDNFKKYFDEKGKDYTKQHPELLNKLSDNYYEEILRYLSKRFPIQQELLAACLGGETFEKVINDLKDMLKYNCSNAYAVVVRNILTIESNVIIILKKTGVASFEDGFDNINMMFKLFNDDTEMVDGLMYLNYVLYEKSGMNLRNDIMHGNLINTDLTIPLLVTFSGLIFVSWVRTINE